MFFATSGILRGNRKKYFPELEGMELIERSDLEYFFTHSNRFLEKEDTHLEAGRKIENFNRPKILFKENVIGWSELMISLNDQNSVFIKGLFAIASDDKENLKELFSILISHLYTYYIFIISCGWGISTRPQIRWNDEYLSFPIFEPNQQHSKRLIELVNQLIKSIRKHQESPEYKFNPDTFDPLLLPEVKQCLEDINNLIDDLHQIKDYERDIIDYALEVSRYQFQESKQDKFLKKIDGDRAFLKRYGEVFLKEIGNIYPEEFIQIEIYRLKYFIAMNFVFKKEEPKDKIIFPKSENEKTVLQALANNFSISKLIDTEDPEKNLFVQKDIKGFEKDSFYIIKPNEFKSWHRARAWYDVTEIKEALQNAELEALNNTSEWA